MKIAYPLLAVFLTLIGTASVQADELTAAKKADIVKLLSLNGTERIIEPFSMMVTQSYMQSLHNCTNCSPKIPEVVRDETLAVLRAHIKGDGGLIEHQLLAYQQHFSHAEIKQLLSFYSSPIGKKLVSESNAMTRETIDASQQWLTALAPEIRQRVDASLTKAGIKPVPPNAPPPSVMQSAPAK